MIFRFFRYTFLYINSHHRSFRKTYLLYMWTHIRYFSRLFLFFKLEGKMYADIWIQLSFREQPFLWYHDLDNMYANFYRRHKKVYTVHTFKLNTLNLIVVSIKTASSSFFLIDQTFGLNESVKSKTCDFLKDSRSITYTYHRLNNLLSGIFIWNIHCGKENGHLNVLVQLHNNIDMKNEI